MRALLLAPRSVTAVRTSGSPQILTAQGESAYTGGGMFGGIVTYGFGDRQYVAVTSGGSLTFGESGSPEPPYSPYGENSMRSSHAVPPPQGARRG